MDVHYSSAKTTGKDEWQTPQELFTILHTHYHFTLDAAADQNNHMVAAYLGPGGKHDDALYCSWDGTVWLNCPYSLTKEFVTKAAQQALYGRATTVMLLAARPDTKYFHEVIWPCASDIVFLKGRLKFGGAKHSAPFPSMLVIFKKGGRIDNPSHEGPNVWTWDWKKEPYPLEEYHEEA